MSEKILLVDDQPKNIQVAGSLLTSNGYEVEFATDGLKALEWISAGGFDLVLLDVMMPGMDGFETCKQLKKLPGGDIPVIFLTAKSDTMSLVEGFQSGGIDYLTKPFQAEELMVRVRTHLEMKQLRARLRDTNKWLENEVALKTSELNDRNIELQQALTKLQTLDKSKDNFLKIISHEIRTPLNGIVGASFLLRQMSDTPEKKEFFDMLEISINRLESFSFAALQITELQAKTGQVPFEQVEMKDLIEEAKKISLIDQQRGYRLEEFNAPQQVQVNRVLFVTALVKIFDNAIRYSPQGSAVTTRISKEENGFRVKIEDEGKGFSEEVLLRKFELFVTGETHVDKNPGLSLPLVKFIIEAHGGTIDIYNTPGRGAVVDIFIPQVN
ncbi:MAG: hybrid sensor histidine kinase/response regulator [bacterium]